MLHNLLKNGSWPCGATLSKVADVWMLTWAAGRAVCLPKSKSKAYNVISDRCVALAKNTSERDALIAEHDRSCGLTKCLATVMERRTPSRQRVPTKVKRFLGIADDTLPNDGGTISLDQGLKTALNRLMSVGWVYPDTYGTECDFTDRPLVAIRDGVLVRTVYQGRIRLPPETYVDRPSHGPLSSCTLDVIEDGYEVYTVPPERTVSSAYQEAASVFEQLVQCVAWVPGDEIAIRVDPVLKPA